MDKLADLVQSLPAEVYNDIFDLTLAVDKDIIVVIDKDYKPPVQLLISKDFRKQFSAKYYGSVTFEIPLDSQNWYRPWLRSLAHNSRSRITTVRLCGAFELRRGHGSKYFAFYNAYDFWRNLHNRSVKRQLSLKQQCFFAWVDEHSGNGQVPPISLVGVDIIEGLGLMTQSDIPLIGEHLAGLRHHRGK